MQADIEYKRRLSFCVEAAYSRMLDTGIRSVSTCIEAQFTAWLRLTRTLAGSLLAYDAPVSNKSKAQAMYRTYHDGLRKSA